MKTFIIGLGNPILGDDGIGPRAAAALAPLLAHRADIEVKELGMGGMRLMEALDGADRAIVLDAMVTGSNPPGTIGLWPLADLPGTKNITCLHDTRLITALEVGRALGMDLPTNIDVFGVEATAVDTFTESLTLPVAQALPTLVNRVLEALSEPPVSLCA